MHGTGGRPRVVVSVDSRGVVSHAGTRLLTDIADATGLTGGFSDAVVLAGRRTGGHDRGRVAVDLATMLADGGQAITDLVVLRGVPQLFGPVASDATAWRLLGLVLDLDASIVVTHSEKEQASPTWKKTFGFHPLFCFCDNTREALAAILRPGRAGSNTTTDHIAVLDAALAQIPDAYRYGTPVLVRADTAGCTHGFLAHIRALHDHGINTSFSVGFPITEPIRDAIRVATAWIPALEADGGLRDGAEVVEITHLVDPTVLAPLPAGTRLIVRRKRPHPGAQLDLFDTIEGLRHQVIATDTPVGQGPIQFLEARHRGHARVEDRIRCGKDTGFGRFPSRQYNINQAWLELALTACDLLAWTQMLCCDGELATAEPKRLRYRLLHVAARITHSARRTRLHIAQSWPWANTVAAAFTRLAALPQPAG